MDNDGGRESSDEKGAGVKRIADDNSDRDGESDDEDNPETKRRKILEATRDIDADSEGSESESDEDSDEEEGDDEDETAELLRELEKIKKERAEQKEKEVGPPITILKTCADSLFLGARKGCRRGRQENGGDCTGKSPSEQAYGFYGETTLGRRCHLQESSTRNRRQEEARIH